MEIICFDKHKEARTSQKKQNNKDYVIDNVIINGDAWKLDQSVMMLIVEHSNNLKLMSNIFRLSYEYGEILTQVSITMTQAFRMSR